MEKQESQEDDLVRGPLLQSSQDPGSLGQGGRVS